MEKVKKPDETLKKMTHCENSDLKKSKHRFADSKYRHNVQFLYRLLKGNSYENVTKDVLLTTVSDDIKRMQNDIIFLAGSQKLDKYNEKFLEVVDIGESIWKKEKNPIVWWNKMQTVLKNVPRF